MYNPLKFCKEKWYQFSLLKKISNPYRLRYPSLKSPPTPLSKRGAKGEFLGNLFRREKLPFFKELKCYNK